MSVNANRSSLGKSSPLVLSSGQPSRFVKCFSSLQRLAFPRTIKAQFLSLTSLFFLLSFSLPYSAGVLSQKVKTQSAFISSFTSWQMSSPGGSVRNRRGASSHLPGRPQVLISSCCFPSLASRKAPGGPKRHFFPPNPNTHSPLRLKRKQSPIQPSTPVPILSSPNPFGRRGPARTAGQGRAPEACERGGRLRRPNTRPPLLASQGPRLHSLSRWSLTGVGSAAGHFPQQESQTSRTSEGEARVRLRSRSLSKLEAQPRETTGRRSPSTQSTTSGPQAPAPQSSSPPTSGRRTQAARFRPRRRPETWGGVSSAPAQCLGGGARRAGPGAPEKLALEFQPERLPQCPLPGLWASDPDRRRPRGRARDCEVRVGPWPLPDRAWPGTRAPKAAPLGRPAVGRMGGAAGAAGSPETRLPGVGDPRGGAGRRFERRSRPGPSRRMQGPRCRDPLWGGTAAPVTAGVVCGSVTRTRHGSGNLRGAVTRLRLRFAGR